MRQLSLKELAPLGSKERTRLNQAFTPRLSHGGDLIKGKRKTTRPFSPKTPIHLVLKASRAKGEWSLLHRKHKAKITGQIYTYAARFKVHIYQATNAGNHLHLLLKASEKKHLSDFLRVLAGRIAVTVTNAKKGTKRIGKFWDYLYFSRLINWGRDFYHMRKYLLANLAETMGRDGKALREKILSGVWEIEEEPPPKRV